MDGKKNLNDKFLSAETGVKNKKHKNTALQHMKRQTATHNNVHVFVTTTGNNIKWKLNITNLFMNKTQITLLKVMKPLVWKTRLTQLSLWQGTRFICNSSKPVVILGSLQNPDTDNGMDQGLFYFIFYHHLRINVINVYFSAQQQYFTSLHNDGICCICVLKQ